MVAKWLTVDFEASDITVQCSAVEDYNDSNDDRDCGKTRAAAPE